MPKNWWTASMKNASRSSLPKMMKRAVLVDVQSYDEAQETLTLLQILAIGEREIAQGKTFSAKEVLRDLRRVRPKLAA
jgi:hypothetical protein